MNFSKLNLNFEDFTIVTNNLIQISNNLFMKLIEGYG